MNDDISAMLRELDILSDSEGKHPLDLCPEEIGRTAAKARDLINSMYVNAALSGVGVVLVASDGSARPIPPEEYYINPRADDIRQP